MVLCSWARSTRIGRVRSPRFCVIKLPNISCFPRMFCIVSLVSQFLNASAPINASSTFEGTSIILIAIAMSQILATHLSITYLGFPAQFFSTYHGGRVAETEWGPSRGSATQNWFEECIRKTKKLQIHAYHSNSLQNPRKSAIQTIFHYSLRIPTSTGVADRRRERGRQRKRYHEPSSSKR